MQIDNCNEEVQVQYIYMGIYRNYDADVVQYVCV